MCTTGIMVAILIFIRLFNIFVDFNNYIFSTNMENTPKKYANLQELAQDYETFAFNAVQIVICHLASFNTAIEMGFGSSLNEIKLSSEEIKALDE